MNKSDRNLQKSKAIITSACQMLEQQARHQNAFWAAPLHGSNADCYVLLHDATKLYCEALGETLGERATPRWCPALPELLLTHPDRCDETLALLAREDFQRLSYFHYS